MNDSERRTVMEEFATLAYYFNNAPLPDFVLLAYVRDVEDLPARGVLAAMRSLRLQKGRSRMPRPADVRALVAPDEADDLESMANTIAGKIVKAVGAIGYNRVAEARERLGELAWRVVNAKGGWVEICSNLKAADTGFFAQCRDLARSFLAEEKARSHAANALQKTTSACKLPPPS